MPKHFFKALTIGLCICCGLIAEKGATDELKGFETLYRQAHDQQTAQHNYWLRLLHFHHPFESPGQWSFRSDVQNAAFFLSPDGQVDPEAELKATLAAFFAPVGDDPNQHPQCRFVARYQWLKTQLDFSKAGLSERACPLFERWANLPHVQTISLVFASAYMGNPASLYGHILLKINSAGDLFAHSLLSPTFNFGAVVDAEDDPLSYAAKGLFGGYIGRFSDERFYNYNHIYGETELRDLWEYELNLDEQQRRRIIYHAWELLQGIDFVYYFALDNCAYRMAGLLEMAWDEQKVNASFGLWTIPINVFYRLHEIENNDAPLIQAIHLIPSRQRRLLQKVDALTPSQKEEFLKIVHHFEKMQDPTFQDLTAVEQAEILDAVIDYNQYETAEERPLLSAQQKQQLLLARSQLPILSKKDDFSALAPPTKGTPPYRFRLAAVNNSALPNTLELGLWLSFHDLLGREEGHLPNTHLVTLDGSMRWAEERLFFQRLEIFNMRSIEIAPIDSPLPSDWSWHSRGAIEPRDLSCRDCLIFNVSGGMGKAASFLNQWKGIYFAFLSPFLRISKEFSERYSLGIEPSFGMTLTPTATWKFEFSWHYLTGFRGERISENQWQWHHRWTLTPNTDARFEIQHHQATEVSFAYNYYW